LNRDGPVRAQKIGPPWKTQQLNQTIISLRNACSSWRLRNDESSSDGRLYCETSNAWCGWCRCSSCGQRKQSGQPIQVQKQARPQVSTACAWLTPWIERQHWRSSTQVSSQKQHFRFLAAGLHLRKAPAGGGAPWKGISPSPGGHYFVPVKPQRYRRCHLWPQQQIHCPTAEA
jgi:hypothetical protein